MAFNPYSDKMSAIFFIAILFIVAYKSRALIPLFSPMFFAPLQNSTLKPTNSQFLQKIPPSLECSSFSRTVKQKNPSVKTL
ncbi:hypothetical protein RDABS01_035311 [Bienertia sinuspersici]